jgi:uncharacterized protein (DUF1800 family)
MSKRHRNQTRKRRHHRRQAAWSEAHATRLLWRAGFGARPDEVARWAAAGKAATLEWLFNGDGGPELEGTDPQPDGKPLNPRSNPTDAALWWLDRMVRSRRPLVEKMTLFWHGHFATKSPQASLLIDQNQMLRAHALGRFEDLLIAVTADPAMLQFLNLANSDKVRPNENYARELMELFTLGSGYGEADVREAARALTGFTGKGASSGNWTVGYDPAHHDPGPEVIFRHTGSFDYQAVASLVTGHPAHGPFLIGKLWAFFVGAPLDRATQTRLVKLYRHTGLAIAPVVSAILSHDALYANLDRPDLVKPPAVFVAGALRAAGAGVTKRAWAYLMATMAQTLLDPPSVAGWEGGPAWMATSALRARFVAANLLLGDVMRGSTPPDLTIDAHVARALDAVGRPLLSSGALAALRATAERFTAGPATADAATLQRRADACQRALRHLIIAGPEAQLH